MNEVLEKQQGVVQHVSQSSEGKDLVYHKVLYQLCILSSLPED